MVQYENSPHFGHFILVGNFNTKLNQAKFLPPAFQGRNKSIRDKLKILLHLPHFKDLYLLKYIARKINVINIIPAVSVSKMRSDIF